MHFDGEKEKTFMDVSYFISYALDQEFKIQEIDLKSEGEDLAENLTTQRLSEIEESNFWTIHVNLIENEAVESDQKPDLIKLLDKL